ncbi:hypothetical protein Tco_1292702 [Tanacetum coccineum]
MCVRKYCVSELSFCASSELGSELTFLASSELRTSELDTSELKTSWGLQGGVRGEYRLIFTDRNPKVAGGSDFSDDHLCLLGLTLHHGNNKFDYIAGVQNDLESILTCHLKIRKDAMDIWKCVFPLEGSDLNKEDRESQLYDDFEHVRQHKGETIHDYYVRFAKLINDMRNIKMTMSRMQLNSKFVNNMLPEWGRFVTAVKLNRGLRDSNYDQLVEKIEDRVTMHGVQVQLVMGELRTELGMLIQVKQGRLSATTTTDLALNVDNVFQADDYPVYDEAGPSYDSDILSEVHDHDHYQDAVCEHHEEHDMHDDDNAVPVVQSNVSSVSNDAYMMIFNDMHEPHAQSVSDTTQNTVVDNSLTAELATYKEQVELYEKRQENLEKGNFILLKCNLLSTINLNMSMVEEVIYLKMKDEALKSRTTAQDQSKALTVTFCGIQKALTKEIKEMKDIFEELEVEVDQNVVNRKHDEIERENLLIAIYNLIADCLSKEVFYIATNSELTVSRFTEMHKAHTIVQTRCLELEAELV